LFRQGSGAATARQAGIGFTVDNDTLAIWPRNGARGGTIPLITPETGLVGYPSYMSQAVRIKMVYNPSIRFGGYVKIDKSIITPANGTWRVAELLHDLVSDMPGGAWFTELTGMGNDQVPG
jgi:hypothetical protein